MSETWEYLNAFQLISSPFLLVAVCYTHAMNYINLRNSPLRVMVDDEDYEELKTFKWRLHTQGYAIRSVWDKPNQTANTTYMHRQLMNPPLGFDTDHLNHNKLDNRKSNLRVCPKSINSFRQRKRRSQFPTSSKFKGVYFDKSRKKWSAELGLKPTRYKLGRFNTEIEAAQAYNVKAFELLGDQAVLNDLR